MSNELADLRCHDCAFRPGTEPHGDETTRLKAALCVMAVETFHCHVEDRVCAGWVAATSARKEPKWRQDVARNLLALLDRDAAVDIQSEEDAIRAIKAAVLDADPYTTARAGAPTGAQRKE